ncbi:nitroreductase family protein [Radiobacillus kanasensis]|uniref:nitroreductase family protein n=1 Tax=Radiobacillus kanasensis TaxID=2844358 RepID=UPI001E36EEAD|nr:nitroreductase family protein [Radiobacillus kanasensis]UFT98860.1 nitroreductase family protein [Radiobacillus kanasensis]
MTTLSGLKQEVKENRKPEYDADPLFVNRWSPRSFSDKKVSEETLLGVLEAARWAPSAMNLQPWRFIVARTEENREKFQSFVMEGNQAWSKKAPVLILLVSEKERDGNEIGTHAFDTGAAWGFLSLQAAQKGLITHAMGGIYKDKAKEVLDIPDHFEVQALVALGYQGVMENLPENLQEREKPSDRRKVKESAFEGTFGKELV